MIFDTIDNLKTYEKILPEADKIIAFVKDFEKNPKEPGKYEIDGKNLFASVQSYISKDPAEARTEAHRAYLDVQYIVSGTEKMLVSPLDTMTLVDEQYSIGKDVAHYKGEFACTAVLHAGSFALLFPQDAHCPGVMHEKKQEMTKIVFKIKR